MSTFSLSSHNAILYLANKICSESRTLFMKQGTEYAHEYAIISFKDIWTYSYLIIYKYVFHVSYTGNLAYMNTFPVCKSDIKCGDSE